MNALMPWQRERILRRLREGASLRRIERETGHRRETIARYAREAGLAPSKTSRACVGRLARRAGRRLRATSIRRA